MRENEPMRYNSSKSQGAFSQNERTTSQYWDEVWTDLSVIDTLSESDFYAGKRGLFSRLIASHLGSVAGKSVIEIGGGGVNHRLLAMAKWMDAEVTALDYSERGMDVLSRLMDRNNVTAEFILDDINKFASHGRKFDIVVHWGVIEHFEDPAMIIDRSVKLLADGGQLLFSMPNMRSAASHLWRLWSPDNWSKHVFHEDKALTQLMSSAGLVDLRAFHFGIPHVKAANWERGSVMQLPADLAQTIASASARFLPIFHKVGGRRWSSERGFYGRLPL